MFLLIWYMYTDFFSFMINC